MADDADYLAEEAVNAELTRRIDELTNLVLEAEAALGEVLEVVQRQSPPRTEDSAASTPDTPAFQADEADDRT
ncbi:hypothetical protein ACIQNU_11505 [Streptomyces sp. NPDC091292]|uniref:hypothetical protein n=1 Tax=Streptomyces sp. NPDC091292 TaxID=3365991 RepID=UPI0038091E65